MNTPTYEGIPVDQMRSKDLRRALQLIGETVVDCINSFGHAELTTVERITDEKRLWVGGEYVLSTPTTVAYNGHVIDDMNEGHLRRALALTIETITDTRARLEQSPAATIAIPEKPMRYESEVTIATPEGIDLNLFARLAENGGYKVSKLSEYVATSVDRDIERLYQVQYEFRRLLTATKIHVRWVRMIAVLEHSRF